MMKDYFLALIGGQLFALDKGCVAGIGIHNESRGKLLEEKGKKFLPLPDGNQAVLCDFQQVMPSGDSRRSKESHFLIVTVQGRFVALGMSGKGRLFMADEGGLCPLPPAFNGIARELVSGILLNCNDLITVLNASALLKTPDWIATETGADSSEVLKRGAEEERQ